MLWGYWTQIRHCAVLHWRFIFRAFLLIIWKSLDLICKLRNPTERARVFLKNSTKNKSSVWEIVMLLCDNHWKFLTFKILWSLSIWPLIIHLHCVKSVQIRSFFWSVFSCIRTEYRDLRIKFPYSIKYRKTRTRKISLFGHFSRSDMIRHKWKNVSK